MSTTSILTRVHLSHAALSALLSSVLIIPLNIGCTGSGGGVVEGAATIRGVVAEFEGGSGQNVEVSVAGTDLSSTTASDGLFVISGVPPGEQTVVFSRDTVAAPLLLQVPSNSVIELQNVRVAEGVVRVSRIRVSESDDDDGDDRDDDNNPDDDDDDDE